MWKDLQQQVKDLFEQTQISAAEVAAYAEQVLKRPVARSEVSHALNDERGSTKKGREILLVSHQYLTTKLEEQNRTLANALKRAQKALDNVQ